LGRGGILRAFLELALKVPDVRTTPLLFALSDSKVGWE